MSRKAINLTAQWISISLWGTDNKPAECKLLKLVPQLLLELLPSAVGWC